MKMRFLHVGTWELPNKETGDVRTGATLWFLPDYPASTGFGIRPEKITMGLEQFINLGGFDFFKPMVGHDVDLVTNLRGRFVSMSLIK